MDSIICNYHYPTYIYNYAITKKILFINILKILLIIVTNTNSVVKF